MGTLLNFKEYITEIAKGKAYVFDVDDTLVTTSSKVHIIADGERIKSITPEEFNSYKLKDNESFDFSDFGSSKLLKDTGKKTPYWQVAQNVNDAIKRGTSTSKIFILTARPREASKDLHSFLVSRGLSHLKLSDVHAVGTKNSDISIAQLKKIVLKRIKQRHDNVTFFDDDTKNIKLANELQTIKSRLVKNK